jgi:signal transduction histidine kinase
MTAAQLDSDHDNDRLRTEMLAVVSHELKTPLATIKGYLTAMLLEEVAWSEAKRQEFLRLMLAEVDYLQEMVGGILDSARVEFGRLEVEPQPLRLPHLAREVTDEMQQRGSAHRFVLDFPRDFPLVDADPSRIKQVFRNLLDNSMKYAPDGGLIVVRGAVRPDDVVISIADQGVGISPEDLIPLFDMYFRAKSPAAPGVAGLGLGLPVSRAIVEAHGGRIWAESALGEGTTLYFSLPRTGPSAGMAAGEEAQP